LWTLYHKLNKAIRNHSWYSILIMQSTYQKVAETLFLKLNRFLGTDTRYLMRGSFWLVIGSMAGMLIGLLLSMTYARYLPKETYGSYRYVLSIISLVGIFSLPSFGATITRSSARGFDGTFRKLSRIMFFSSFGISIVCVGAATFFFFRDQKELTLALAIAALFIPFVEGLGSWRAYLDGKKQFRNKSVYNITTQIVYGLLMAAAVISSYALGFGLALTLTLLVGTYMLTHALPNVYFYFRTLRIIPPHAPEEPGSIRHALHLSVSSVPATFATYIDGVLLYHFLGPSALAIYSFAILLPEQVKALLATYINVSLPKLATQTADTNAQALAKKTLPGKILKASLLSAVIIGGYIIVAPFAYQILFPAYMESAPYSQIFALSLLLFPFSIFGPFIQMEGNVWKIYLESVTGPFIQIILLLILIPQFGIWGAVGGRVIGRILNVLLEFIIFIK